MLSRFLKTLQLTVTVLQTTALWFHNQAWSYRTMRLSSTTEHVECLRTRDKGVRLIKLASGASET